MPIKFQEQDSDRCGGASGFEVFQCKYLHKEACIVQRKAAIVTYLHIYTYLDINKVARFVPYILKNGPRKDMALEQGMTTGVGHQTEADQDLLYILEGSTHPGIIFE